MFLNSNELHIQEFNLKKQVGFDYWHTNILDKNNKSISAGFGDTKNLARSIAYAEYLERSTFFELKKSNTVIYKKWGLDLIPTGCGFAAGFNLKNTVLRSIGESLERWTMSKWIDENYFIEEKNSKELEPSLDPISKWFLSEFDSVKFYKKTVAVLYKNDFLKFDIGFTVALKDDGVFPGCAFDYSNTNLWQHALLESYRHFLIFKNCKVNDKSFPNNKVQFFAKNSESAIRQIENAKLKNWPNPIIGFHENEYISEKNFFLSRTIINGWKSWNLGSVERFLY